MNHRPDAGEPGTGTHPFDGVGGLDEEVENSAEQSRIESVEPPRQDHVPPEALWRERIQARYPVPQAQSTTRRTQPDVSSESHACPRGDDQQGREEDPVAYRDAGNDAGARPAFDGEPPSVASVDTARHAKRRRRRRIIAMVAVIQLVVLAAGDRFAVSAAEDQMVSQIEASIIENLDCDVTPPTVSDVSIGGFPFLTQVAFGRFKDIGVTVEGVPTPGPRISAVEAHLRGLHIPVTKMLTNSVGEVPVDEVEATVHLDYTDVNTYLAGQPGAVQINPVDGGDQVEVSGIADIPVVGSQEVGGITTFEIRDNKLTLVPSEISLRGTLNISIPVPGGLGNLLPDIPIPVGALPFDVSVVKAATDATGLSLTATARDITLPEADTKPRNCPAADTDRS
ncbi:Protein of unknown function (DUF2993) [Parafrankia irregularis]|uniref:DUF2993 domain-containing protein n=2 Tax=Frankiaceae TaxID=74712 RepID=A0A0S4QF07_9ACTN|nr:Protein of unknown function (DUF2993) [Parafrankia irregularis]